MYKVKSIINYLYIDKNLCMQAFVNSVYFLRWLRQEV